MASKQSNARTIPGLDGLRAIAVLAVFLFHVDGIYLGFGWLGVQFFFVLSGFLITDILLRMKTEFPVRQYFQRFYGRRFLRIFPVYYFYLLLILLLVILAGLQALTPLRDELRTLVRTQLPYATLYVYDFFYASSKYNVTAFLTHFWSLSVEEQFYILWPLILFLTPGKNIKKVFGATIILGPVFRLITFFIYTRYDFSFLLKNAYLAIYALPLSHVDAFAMGAYASQFKLPSSRKQLIIAACIVPLLGYLAQYLATGIIDLGTLGYEFKMWTGYKFVWGYSLLNYFFVLVLYNVYQSRLFLPVLDSFVIRYLGKISYGIYIYHVAIIHIIFSYAQHGSRSFPGALILGICAFMITVTVASLSYHFLEKPILGLKDKIFPLKPD